MPPTRRKKKKAAPAFDVRAKLREIVEDLYEPEMVEHEFDDGPVSDEEVELIEQGTRELLKDRSSRVRFWRKLIKLGKRAAKLAGGF